MSPREARLRKRIDTLTQQRDSARRYAKLIQHETGLTIVQTAAQLLGHCELCGGPAVDRLCHAHADLAA